MFKIILALAALTMTSTMGAAQGPKQQKLMACRQLALERGFVLNSRENKGAIKPKEFVQGCMKGTQK